MPDDIDDLRGRRRLLVRYCIEIWCGFGPLAGKIFRTGMMGGSTEANVLLMPEKLEESLREEGYRSAVSGRKAMEEFYASHAFRAEHELTRISE